MAKGTSRGFFEMRNQGPALWLLLLSILTHALVPGGSPVQRTAGSAFSVSTAEVSLAPRRAAVSAKRHLPSDDDGGWTGGDGDDAADALAATFVPPALEPPPPPASAGSTTASGGAAAYSARAPPAA